MTFAFEAAEKLRRAESLVREVIACELLVARQAWHLRSSPVAAGLHDHFEQIAADVQAVEHDRPLGADIEALVELLASGAFQ